MAVPSYLPGLPWAGDGPFPPRSASQAAVTTTVGAAVAATAATSTTPFGYTTGAQADAIVTNINTIRTDVLALAALVNQLRSDLVAMGLLKGSA